MAKAQTTTNDRAESLATVGGFRELVAEAGQIVKDMQDVPPPDIQTKAKAAKIVNEGRTNLPPIYRPPFLNPIQNILSQAPYPAIRQAIPAWEDWLTAVDQRRPIASGPATRAFEEVIRDLFDGFLSLEQRLGVKPPDYQTVAPLVKWGKPEYGPYTWPAHWHELGVTTSIVSLPPAYQRNVTLWAALGHEAAGHDIFHADEGLLTELAEKVRRALLDADLPGEVDHEGRAVPLKEFAADYWSQRIDETASDVAGLLNLGPAAGVGLAALFIPLGGDEFSRYGVADDPHPIDLLRIHLAIEVIRDLKDLQKSVADAWIRSLQGIAEEFSEEGELFLVRRFGGQWFVTTTIPREPMLRTVPIVAETIAHEPMASLENLALGQINTWSTNDEHLAVEVADAAAQDREVPLRDGTDGPETFAAHVLAGGVVAMAQQGADFPCIHDRTLQALNELYDRNPVWTGFPLRLPRDPAPHPVYLPARGPKGKVYLPIKPVTSLPMLLSAIERSKATRAEPSRPRKRPVAGKQL